MTHGAVAPLAHGEVLLVHDQGLRLVGLVDPPHLVICDRPGTLPHLGGECRGVCAIFRPDSSPRRVVVTDTAC